MGSRPERERRTEAWASLSARATVRCWPSLPKRLAGRESMAREKSSRWGPAAVTRRRISSSRRRSSWAGKSGSEPGRWVMVRISEEELTAAWAAAASGERAERSWERREERVEVASARMRV